MKRCNRCSEIKALDCFGPDRNITDGKRRTCRECCNAMAREWWKQTNVVRLAKQRNTYHSADPEERDARRLRSRDFNRKLRLEFIQAYGGKCECCQETEPKFLTLEHRFGDGKQHRAKMKSNVSILLDLKRRGWPKEAYGLLCFNCNTAKAFWGECPHKQSQGV